jgi:hypothetical protein
LLRERQVIREIAAFEVHGVPILAGALGALKPGKLGPEALRILRIRLVGMQRLTGPLAWLEVLLEEGELFLLYRDDLTCSFYIVEFPEVWGKYFAFALPVPARYLMWGQREDVLGVG